MRTHQGIVKWFSTKTGDNYGFIEVAPSVKQEFGVPMERDIYVHGQNIVGRFPKQLHAGERVRFELIKESKGPRAVNVQIVQEAIAN